MVRRWCSAACSAARSDGRLQCCSTTRASIRARSPWSGWGRSTADLAHVPLSALVMVSELAGSYDLLVPLMLAEGIAFVALRKRSSTRPRFRPSNDSPVHRRPDSLDALAQRRVKNVMTVRMPFHVFAPTTSLVTMRDALTEASWQTTFPVVDGSATLVGVVDAGSIGLLAAADPVHTPACASDLMHPPAALTPEDDLKTAAELILSSGLRQLPVVGPLREILGFIEESEVTRAYLAFSAIRSEVTE